MPSSRMTSTTSGWTRLAGRGAGRERVVAAGGGALEQRGRHLGAAGVVEADEEGGGHGQVGVEGADRGASASAPPTSWATTNGATEAGAMPAKVSENMRPTVMAGLAKLVELVNQ